MHMRNCSFVCLGQLSFCRDVTAFALGKVLHQTAMLETARRQGCVFSVLVYSNLHASKSGFVSPAAGYKSTMQHNWPTPSLQTINILTATSDMQTINILTATSDTAACYLFEHLFRTCTVASQLVTSMTIAG
jgi:hypothetical protein